MNLCSLVVHARPERQAGVRTALEATAGVAVHGTAEGRFVVTVEGGDDEVLAETLAGLGALEGVINTVMVYHYCGADEEQDIATEEESP